MTIIVDVDNTVCKTIGNDYFNSIPIEENIAKINKLFDEGNNIIYWTSRGNTSKTNWLMFTLEQLTKWGCKYNSIQVNKPSYDIWIDDKSKQIEQL